MFWLAVFACIVGGAVAGVYAGTVLFFYRRERAYAQMHASLDRMHADLDAIEAVQR